MRKELSKETLFDWFCENDFGCLGDERLLILANELVREELLVRNTFRNDGLNPSYVFILNDSKSIQAFKEETEISW